MPGRIPISLLVALAACVWLLVLGAAFEVALFKPFSLVVGTISVMLAAFDRWVWKWPVVRKLVGRPVLKGTYVGVLNSNWTDPNTNDQVAPIEAALVLRQTYTGLSVTLFTDESSSGTLTASIVEGEDGRKVVVGLYRSEPRVLIQDRSRIHHGGLKLEIVGADEDRLVGSYWNDRGPSGEMNFRRVSTGHALGFDTARELTAASGKADRLLPAAGQPVGGRSRSAVDAEGQESRIDES